VANPKGNLAGYTDVSVPGWQARAFNRVKARQKGSKRHTERQDGVRTVWDRPFRVLLDEAASRRGMSMAGYCRRAIAAFVAHDLGITPRAAAQYMPIPTPYGRLRGSGHKLITRDNLAGYGKWVITGLEEAPDDTTDDGI
jgi:hypothetical protein